MQGRSPHRSSCIWALSEFQTSYHWIDDAVVELLERVQTYAKTPVELWYNEERWDGSVLGPVLLKLRNAEVVFHDPPVKPFIALWFSRLSSFDC